MARRRAGDDARDFEIGAVEEATGIPRETLRAWERRYGFPAPARAPNGDRRYRNADLLKLRELRRLINAGFRPHAIMPLPLERLRTLGRDTAGLDAPYLEVGHALLEEVLPVLRRDGADALQARFHQLVARHGLETFVLWWARPLAIAIGEAWCGGAVHVFEEHVITELLGRAIWSGLDALPGRGSLPRVALATLQPERHTLGLLMVNALLALAGAACVWVGPTDVDDLALCARRQDADVVALSFSAYFPHARLGTALAQLRRRLPRRTLVWAGGAGLADLGEPPRGVVVMTALEDAPAALAGSIGARSH